MKNNSNVLSKHPTVLEDLLTKMQEHKYKVAEYNHQLRMKREKQSTQYLIDLKKKSKLLNNQIRKMEGYLKDSLLRKDQQYSNCFYQKKEVQNEINGILLDIFDQAKNFKHEFTVKVEDLEGQAIILRAAKKMFLTLNGRQVKRPSKYQMKLFNI